jgi:type IV pilus assembly protein PilM
MLNFFEPVKVVGLEALSYQVKGAEITLKNGKPFIHSLFSLAPPLTQESIGKFSRDHSLIVTALDGSDVLVRPLYVPLIKEKDLDAAFIFQAEPCLPYPIDQAIPIRQTFSKTAEGTHLTLLSTQKTLLKKHLDGWQEVGIEPEQTACIQSALCQFGVAHVSEEESFLILHLSDTHMTCVLIEKGKLAASHNQRGGLEIILKAYESEGEELEYFNQIHFDPEFLNSHPTLSEAIRKLQQPLAKIAHALVKDASEGHVGGILIVGNAVLFPQLDERLAEAVNLPLLQCRNEPESGFDTQKIQTYAVPIGLALGTLQKPVNFRQQEFVYPHPWLRMRTPLISYFILITLLTGALYLFGQTYLRNSEDQFRQEYVDLLLSMNKSHEQFERDYLAKHPDSAKKTEGVPQPIAQLNRHDLLERMEFLQKDLQTAPDSFPLFANVPRVSDVLAWLATHPLVTERLPDGKTQTRLQIENFNYSMVKRPDQGKKKEKYQVKIELEFSSPTPKWAREFHDSLIAANDFVDPKGEVKWSSNRDHYKTSFYLKDKTSYNQ